MPEPSVPLGILGSSGGSALAAAAECLRNSGYGRRWVVLTDRACGLAEWASKHAEASHLLPYKECGSFSQQASAYFRQHGVERVLLFYTRRIGAELFGSIDTCNIHPSLLPAFPGIGSVAKAMTANTGVIGATLHEVDAGLDTGKILLQVRSSIDSNTSLAFAERISFAQKILLTLHWEQQERHPAPHALLPEVNAAFDRFRAALGLCTRIDMVSLP